MTNKVAKAVGSMQQFVETITAASSPIAGWRWFSDDGYVVLEPRRDFISSREMAFLDRYPCATNIEVVFRSTPHTGIYLRFKLLSPEANPGVTVDDQIEQIVTWFEEQAVKERELLDSGRCNNRLTTYERLIVYKAAAMSVRGGAWRKTCNAAKANIIGSEINKKP